MTSWGKSIRHSYISSGEFVRPLVGPKKGEMGEIVYYYQWGGIDAKFKDDTIVTYANDDVQPAKVAHRYYYLNRPPSIGCQPSGFTDREAWQPKQQIPGTEWTAHGWVEYPEPLKPYDIWRWEFYPADPDELDAYLDWREENNR